MSTIDKIRYNGIEYNVGGTNTKREIIYDADSLVLEKCGNIMHLYTTMYVAQGVIEAFTIPEEYRMDKRIDIPCNQYSSLWNSRTMTIRTDGTMSAQDTSGKATTDYTYLSFNVTWFI